MDNKRIFYFYYWEHLIKYTLYIINKKNLGHEFAHGKNDMYETKNSVGTDPWTNTCTLRICQIS